MGIFLSTCKTMSSWASSTRPLTPSLFSNMHCVSHSLTLCRLYVIYLDVSLKFPFQIPSQLYWFPYCVEYCYHHCIHEHCLTILFIPFLITDLSKLMVWMFKLFSLKGSFFLQCIYWFFLMLPLWSISHKRKIT